MMNISDQLSGIEFPILTSVQRKKVLIESLPHQWRVNFNNTGLDYVTMSTIEIENYFTTLQKEQADKDHKNRKKKNKAQVKGKRKHGSLSNQCRKHPNGRHNWEDCYQNPKNNRDFSNSNSSNSYSRKSDSRKSD